MKKIVFIFLISISIILSGFLIYNFIKCNEITRTKEKLLNEINVYETKIQSYNNSKNELEKLNENLKVSNEEKLKEYEKWGKWTQEIEERMS